MSLHATGGSATADGVAVIPGSNRRDRVRGAAFKSIVAGCLAVGIVSLIVLLIYIAVTGIPGLSLNLFTNFGSASPAKAGAQPAIIGTIAFIVLVFFMAVPVGVGAAIYMEEFASPDRWYNRVLEVNIQNLAAIPSIVFGILGLGVIARGFDFGTGTLITGAVTLTLLVLPTVIIAAREAIRAVPDSIREGGMALGSTRLQTIGRLVLPSALPGIATGSILALSRAIGETAPLLMLAVPVYLSHNPSLLKPFSEFTSLPMQIFGWTTQPNPGFQKLAAAAIIVLLAILLIMNAGAIFIRNRYQRKWW